MKALVVLALLAMPGCVSFALSRSNFETPILEEDLAALVPGEADLTLCLDRLGAPHLVWEYQGDGIAMAYAWFDGFGWGFTLSGGRFVPGARFSFDNDAVDQNGVVLTFDNDLVLQRVRRGYLKDLVPRQRPAPVDGAE